MITQPDTTVDVDVDLTAGCAVFTECPRTAAWLVVFPEAHQTSRPICEHHRPVLLAVMSGEGLDTTQIRFVRI